MTLLRRILRYFLYAVLVVVAAAIGAVAVLTGTERGRANLAGIISDLASSPERKVAISGIHGIWSGALRLDQVVVEDSSGPWLVLRDVALDWSPLALLSKRFEADRVAAGRIELARLPASGSQESEGGQTTLPVSIDVKEIDLPEIALGKALAGAGIAELSAKGSVHADPDPLAVQTKLNIARHDGRQGTVDAAIDFAPADNRLTLDVKASEPGGGIIANLLKLPDAPPVDIAISGKGPIADWSGSGTFAVSGQVVTRVSGRHRLTDKGHYVEAKGDGAFERFLPESLKPLLAGQATFDIAGTATKAGGLSIERANIESDSIHAAASGTADPTGASDLSAEIAARDAPVVLSLPTGGAPITVTFNTVTARAFGDGKAPMVDVAGNLVSVITGGTEVRGLAAQIHSDGFDIRNRSGPVKISLAADSLKTDVATLAPLVAGRVLVDLAGTVSPEEVSLDQGTLRSDALNAGVTAKVRLADLAMSLKMNADAVSTALPPQIQTVLGPRVQFSASATRDPQGAFAANAIELSSGSLTASGTASATGTDIEADLKGRLGDVSVLSPLVGVPVAGAVDFSLTAKGARTAPEFSVFASSSKLTASGQEVVGIRLGADGKADIAEPAANVSLTASVDGQPFELKAGLATAGGKREINGLSLSLGESRLAGDLVLGDGFLPAGTLTLDIPDLAPLASLAGQVATGDIEGTIRLSAEGDVPSVAIDATSRSIARADLAAKAITVDAAISNYLKAPGISGTIKAGSVTSGETVVSGIGLDLKQDGEWTDFSGAATVRDIPATIAGRAKIANGTTTVELASGGATVRGIEAKITGSSTITVTNGTAQIANLALDVGGGAVTISGSAGEALDLTAEVAAVPAALANGFVQNLDAAGTLGGTAHVTGTASDPTVAFDVHLADAETSQTRQAKAGPLDLAAKGSYSQSAGVALKQATVTGEGISASASGTVKPAGGHVFALDLDADAGSLPLALANGFVQNLDAAGTLSGAFQVGGTTADPSVRFDAKAVGIETSQTRQTALGAFDLTAKGSYSKAAGVALDGATVRGENISGKASGTINPNGPSDFALDLATNGPSLPLPLGSAESPITIAIQAVSIKAAGEKNAARLDISATLPSVATKDAKVEGLSLALHSDAFDIEKRTGPVSGTATANSIGPDNQTIAPLLAGRITAKFAGNLAADAVTIDSASLNGEALNGEVSGRVSLADGAIDLNVKADAASAALPSAARPVLGERAQLSAALKRDAKGNISASGVNLSSGPLTAQGDASLTNGNVAAKIEGMLADVLLLSKDAQGAIAFSATAEGPSSGPNLSLTVASDHFTVASREITGLKLTATGKADLENPAANVSLTGTVAGQPLKGSAVLKTSQGQRQINELLLSLGPNKISGDLVLDDNFVPVGTVSLDLPDIGPLAALALEKAEGDLRGSIVFSKTDGAAQVAVKAKTAKVSRGDLSARNVDIDALIADYLKTPVISGTVRADSVTSGGTVIIGIDIDLKREGEWTGFSGGATLKDIPAKAAGRVKVSNGTTTVELKSGEATIRGIKAAIAGPSTVTIADGTARLDKVAVGIGGGTATISGTAGETLNLNATLSKVPLSVANSLAPGLDAAGSVSGTARVTGAAGAPAVAFDIDAAGVQTSQTRGAGFGALSIGSKGTFSGNKLNFNATIGEGSGLSLKGGGTVTTAGAPNLSLDFSGQVPFGFLAQKLAAQGLSLTGTADVAVKLSGPASKPVINGTVRASGARFVDVKSGVAINDIALDVSLGGNQARINRLTGKLATRGTLTASGTVGIDPAAGFPADLSIKLTDGRYTDGRIVTANLSGDLAVKGPLATAPVVSGTINLARTVITVPQKLPSSLSTLNVKHKDAPADVRAQERALHPQGASNGGGGGGGGLSLDVTINAPNRIFVQGRGIDAELGGSLKLTGPASAPQAVGKFDLQRGRLTILSRRLTFTEGTLTFSGSLVPYINLTAESRGGDATVTVTVSGEANNPKFTFSSVPALPEDEVLARLIFGQSMSKLSPLQIAQLAEAAGQLAGVGGSTSLLENLRSAIGIDDLDVTTDETGAAAVSAGKYLNDRTYLTLQKGEKPGSGRARIDFNVGRGVKLRGEATDAGEAKGGIFFEKEY